METKGKITMKVGGCRWIHMKKTMNNDSSIIKIREELNNQMGKLQSNRRLRMKLRRKVIKKYWKRSVKSTISI